MNMYQPFSAAVIDLLVLDLLAGVLEDSLWLPKSSISLCFVLIAHRQGKMFDFSLLKTKPPAAQVNFSSEAIIIAGSWRAPGI